MSKKLVSVVGIVVFVTVSVVSVAWGLGVRGDDARASRSQFLGDAIRQLQADDGSVAAYVDGVGIPEAKLRAFLVLSTTQFGQSGQPSSVDDYRSQLIDQELLYAEAVRRGFDPTDDEVLNVARATQAGLQELMSGDSELSADMRAVFAQVKGTPYDVDVYDTSEVMLDSFRRQLAINSLRNDLLNDLAPADAANPAKREARVDEFVAALKQHADIRIVAN
jgi:hypothetical protein